MPLTRQFAILLLALSACTTTQQGALPRTHLYYVRRIKEFNTCYLIYATRNDSVFRILAPKASVDSCQSIRRGGSYRLALYHDGMLSEAAKTTYYYKGEYLVRLKHPRNRLYYTDSLVGLCFK